MGSDLTRRTVLATAAAAAASAALGRSLTDEAAPKMIKPPMLKPGDLVGMVAPASASVDALDVQKAKQNLERLGLKVLVGKNILSNYGYLAGTDQQRADDFNQMVNLPEVRGIACMRGGYGCCRILPLLDYDAIRQNPKAIWGFSDVTALVNAITQRCRLVTFHGPTPASSWGEFDLDWMRRTLMSGTPAGEIARGPIVIEPTPKTLVPGKARGHLVGGNLTLLSAVAGSPYEPHYDGAILFIEEIGEEPYRVDRMLTHLMLSGATKHIRGLAFGSMKLRISQTASTDPKDFTMLQVLEDRAKAIGVPCCTGFSFGHIADQVTMPIGVRASLDADAQTLTILESAVSAR